MLQIYSFYFIACILRIVTIAISKKNEQNLLKQRAKQFGQKNTIVLIAIHTIFYISCFIEYSLKLSDITTFSYIGMGLWFFSFIMLMITIYSLHPIWTIKIYIASNHKINNNFLFRNFRHPIYLFNIIPELIGLSLSLQAQWTFITLFPIYIIILAIRIYQEENAMKGMI
jgi:isoprenylcysteine carboxyl methyltransferase (ICMT) family protein YpbQ